MQQLKEIFVYLGFHHAQLHREGKIALYKRASVDLRTLEIETDPIVNFEVIKIQHQDANTITVGSASFEVAEKEIYPRGISWGALGFSFNTYSDAKKHFDGLVEKENKKPEVISTEE